MANNLVKEEKLVFKRIKDKVDSGDLKFKVLITDEHIENIMFKNITERMFVLYDNEFAELISYDIKTLNNLLETEIIKLYKIYLVSSFFQNKQNQKIKKVIQKTVLKELKDLSKTNKDLQKLTKKQLRDFLNNTTNKVILLTDVLDLKVVFNSRDVIEKENKDKKVVNINDLLGSQDYYNKNYNKLYDTLKTNLDVFYLPTEDFMREIDSLYKYKEMLNVIYENSFSKDTIKLHENLILNLNLLWVTLRETKEYMSFTHFQEYYKIYLQTLYNIFVGYDIPLEAIPEDIEILEDIGFIDSIKYREELERLEKEEQVFRDRKNYQKSRFKQMLNYLTENLDGSNYAVYNKEYSYSLDSFSNLISNKNYDENLYYTNSTLIDFFNYISYEDYDLFIGDIHNIIKTEAFIIILEDILEETFYKIKLPVTLKDDNILSDKSGFYVEITEKKEEKYKTKHKWFYSIDSFVSFIKK